jgi:hypothetical protein
MPLNTISPDLSMVSSIKDNQITFISTHPCEIIHECYVDSNLYGEIIKAHFCVTGYYMILITTIGSFLFDLETKEIQVKDRCAEFEDTGRSVIMKCCMFPVKQGLVVITDTDELLVESSMPEEVDSYERAWNAAAVAPDRSLTVGTEGNTFVLIDSGSGTVAKYSVASVGIKNITDVEFKEDGCGLIITTDSPPCRVTWSLTDKQVTSVSSIITLLSPDGTLVVRAGGSTFTLAHHGGAIINTYSLCREYGDILGGTFHSSYLKMQGYWLIFSTTTHQVVWDLERSNVWEARRTDRV